MSLETKQSAKGELVFTSFLFVAGATVFWDTMNLATTAVDGVIGPKVFPFIIAISLMVLSSLQLISVIRGNLGKPEDIEGGTQVSKPNWKGLGIVIGALVAFILLQEIIGFMISATILFFSVAWTLGERKWLRLLLISIAISVAIYFGFTAGLQLNLPLGFEFLFPAEVEEW